MAGLGDTLFENGVETVVDWIVGAIIALSATALTRSLVRRGRVHIGPMDGLTCQSPEVFVVGLLCGSLALGALVWGLLDPATLKDDGSATAWLLLMGGFTLGFLVTAIYAQHVWSCALRR